MLTEYLEKRLKKAKYKILRDGSYFGEIPGLKGVWADGNTLEDCRKELREVLEDWILLKVRNNEKIPGFQLRVDRREMVKRA